MSDDLNLFKAALLGNILFTSNNRYDVDDTKQARKKKHRDRYRNKMAKASRKKNRAR